MPDRIDLPYGRHLIDDDDVAAVAQVLRSDFLTTGPAVGQFEAALAARTGAGEVVSCANGTAALHLACLAAGISHGDAVVVPAVTFAATANAARFCGAEVVFADVDASTGLITGETMTAALDTVDRGRLRAVFPVHLNGQCARLDDLADVADRHGLQIVEDACHALGGSYGGNDASTYRVGDCHYSTMTTFSFHPVKTIAMGEGGAVTTNDAGLSERLRRLRNHGIVRDPAAMQHPDQAVDASGAANPWYYEIDELGYNYRASDIHCALGLSQIGKLDAFARRRQQLAARYDAALADLAPHVQPVQRDGFSRPVWHLYVVLIDFETIGLTRGQLMRELATKGIGTQVHYLPLHRQPYYRHRYGDASLPGADRYYASALSLPLFPDMADEDVDRVAAALGDLVRAG